MKQELIEKHGKVVAVVSFAGCSSIKFQATEQQVVQLIDDLNRQGFRSCCVIQHGGFYYLSN